MATIPRNQKFHTIAHEVDTSNRGSASTNADRTIYTMADITTAVKLDAGHLSGSGTAGIISKFTDAETLADSIIGDDGTNITIPAYIKLEANSTTYMGFQVGAGNSDNKVHIKIDGYLSMEAQKLATYFYADAAQALTLNSSGTQVKGDRLLTKKLHVTSVDVPTGAAKGPLNIVFGVAPTAASFGMAGDIIIDASAIYVCTVTGVDPTAATWLKANLGPL